MVALPEALASRDRAPAHIKALTGYLHSQSSNFLHSIEWRISHNVLIGYSPDTPEFRTCIPGAEADEQGKLPAYGEFTLTSAPLTGNQETKIRWRSDEGQVTYYLLSVSLPN